MIKNETNGSLAGHLWDFGDSGALVKSGVWRLARRSGPLPQESCVNFFSLSRCFVIAVSVTRKT